MLSQSNQKNSKVYFLCFDYLLRAAIPIGFWQLESFEKTVFQEIEKEKKKKSP